MKANEFCYWLQGYFEIGALQGADVLVLSPKAELCIKSHIELVNKVDPDHSNVFVAWLEARLDRKDQGIALGTGEIRRFLGAQFQHVIDPSYGGDQKALNKIHGTIGGSNWPTDGLIRC